MITERLRKFLDEQNVDYQVVPHPHPKKNKRTSRYDSLTAQEIAKVAIVRAGSRDVMVVLPSCEMLDLLKLALVLGTETVSLERDEDISKLFPDCEPGALPAIGRLYDLPCFVDETLLDQGDVFFEAGNHRDSIKMTSDEFWRVAEAEVGDFRVRHA